MTINTHQEMIKMPPSYYNPHFQEKPTSVAIEGYFNRFTITLLVLEILICILRIIYLLPFKTDKESYILLATRTSVVGLEER